MAKKKNTLGKIQAAELQVEAIREKIDANTKQYKELWKKHVEALEDGDGIEDKQLEHRYYHLQGTVANQLDRERVEALNKLEDLQGYKARLEQKLPREKRSLERKKEELESVKAEAESMIQHQEQLIVNA